MQRKHPAAVRRSLGVACAVGLTAVALGAVASPAAAAHESFSYTGSTQTFTVPAGVTSILVGALGGGGGGATGDGGGGCQVNDAELTVTPGEEITVIVGGGGEGGDSGSGAGGGGSSSVNAAATGNQVIAGGGGGGSSNGDGGDGCSANTGAGGSGTGSNSGDGAAGDGFGGGNGQNGAGGNGGNSYGDGGWGGDGPGLGGFVTGMSGGGGAGGGGYGGGGGGYQTSGGGAGGSIGPNATYEPGTNGGDVISPDASDGAVTISWETVPGPATFSDTDFGSVAVGSAADLSVTVTNTGSADLTPSDISVAGSGVTVNSGSPGTCAASTPIPAAEVCTVKVQWTPSAAGALTGASLTVTYPSGVAPSDTTSLTGEAVGTGNKSAQSPATKCVISGGKLPQRGSRVLTRPACLTNAGQVVGTRIKVKQRVTAVRGDIRPIRLRCQTAGTRSAATRLPADQYGAQPTYYCARGKLVIVTNGISSKVRIGPHLGVSW